MSYTYDIYNAENTRIRSICNGVTTYYTYNTNAKLSQLLHKQTQGVVTKYVYGLGLIGEEKQGTFKTYHFDYRGSTVVITDMAGNITDTFAYDTYGKLISRTGETDTPFLYNGRDGVMTEDNGLYYMRARYYSPELRRFINADIVAGEISNSPTLNRYAYANGNPVSNVDPLGLSAERGSVTPLSTNSISSTASETDKEFWAHIFEGMKNADGTSSLYDNRRSLLHRNDTFHEQLFMWDPVESDLFGFGFDFGLITGGWEYENFDLSLFDFINVSSKLIIDEGCFDASLSFCIYSPSVSFAVGDYWVTVSADIGSVGWESPVFFGHDEFGLNLDDISISIKRK